MGVGAGDQGFLQVLLDQFLRVALGGAGDDLDAFMDQKLLGLLPQAGGDDVGDAQLIQPLRDAARLMRAGWAPVPWRRWRRFWW